MKTETTQTRVRREWLTRLAGALKLSKNEMSVAKLIDQIFSEVVEQIERDEPGPGPLAIVETLRRQRGVAGLDELRGFVMYRERMEKELAGMKSHLTDLEQKFLALEKRRHRGK